MRMTYSCAQTATIHVDLMVGWKEWRIHEVEPKVGTLGTVGAAVQVRTATA